MDLLTGFGLGATLWTILHFMPTSKSTDQLILDTWSSMGLKAADENGKKVLLPQKKKGAWFLPAGLSPTDIERSLPALSYQLNANVEMEVKGKAIFLHLYPSLPKMVPYAIQDLSKYKLGLVLGQTNEKECHIHDMNDTNPYIIVCGSVGMGKSNLLTLALKQITENYTPEHVKYYLVDLKLGVELGPWESNAMCSGACFESKELPQMLTNLTREIRRRMKLFRKAGVYKVDEYNKLGLEHLPYLLLIVDEYAELAGDKEIESKVRSLLSIARAGGLRCIVSTQRPSVDVVSGSIKGLIPCRLCFSVGDQVSSRVAIDRVGAEVLGNIPGRGLLLSGARLRGVQIMMASPPVAHL